MAEHLIDTNVLSKIFYGDAKLRQFVEGLDAAVNTIIYIECIQGSIKKFDRERIKRSLDQLNQYYLTYQISNHAVELIEKYSGSDGLFLADALIASTAIIHDLTLVTYNLKDFDFIEGLSVIKP